MNQEKNNNSVQDQDGNSTKPLLCEVAVVCPSQRTFQNWQKENKKPDENYTWVYSINNVRGKIFDRIEKLYKYYEIRDIDDVLYYLETRLKRNNCKHENIKREDGLDECLDCGVRNY